MAFDRRLLGRSRNRETLLPERMVLPGRRPPRLRLGNVQVEGPREEEGESRTRNPPPWSTAEMIRYSMEIPTSRLTDWSPLCDLDFVLAHKVLEDKSYADFFANRPRDR